jgi:alkaline phosphatase D
VRTEAATAFVAKLVADRVEPGRRYSYALFIDGVEVERPYSLRFQTQSLWQWRTDPPDFRFATASCFYVNDPPYDRPGEPYGGGFEILQSIVDKNPDAMLWLGDNVYLREPDWYTRTGILYRYTHTRSFPGLQPLLGSVHQYATWDDHDYGPDNSDWTFREKRTSLEVFNLFWGNPEAGKPELDGIATSFEWGDVEFFLVDDRWYRTPEHRRTPGRRLLGPKQLEWLVDALTASRATFKIVAVGSQVLSPVAKWEAYATFPEERAELLRRIRENEISGVLFVTGDVHFTVLTRLDRPGTYPLYDLTISPLTAGVSNVDPETYENYLAVPGTLYVGRNFATLDFTGPRAERAMIIRVYDTRGKELWTRTISANELR